MTILEIYQKYVNKDYQTKITYPQSKDYKHIEDEDKSIRWNREEKERLEREYEKAKEYYNIDQSKLDNQLRSDMIEALQEEYHVNEKQAEIIYGYAYSEKHSCMTDVFWFAGELAVVYEKIDKAR